jgi:hypothetical protein
MTGAVEINLAVHANDLHLEFTDSIHSNENKAGDQKDLSFLQSRIEFYGAGYGYSNRNHEY